MLSILLLDTFEMLSKMNNSDQQQSQPCRFVDRSIQQSNNIENKTRNHKHTYRRLSSVLPSSSSSSTTAIWCFWYSHLTNLTMLDLILQIHSLMYSLSLTTCLSITCHTESQVTSAVVHFDVYAFLLAQNHSFQLNLNTPHRALSGIPIIFAFKFQQINFSYKECQFLEIQLYLIGSTQNIIMWMFD